MTTKFKPFKFKAGTFFGSYYQRGGRLVDKHKNVQFKPISFRNIHTGIVTNSSGKVLGVERAHQHHYGSDPKRIKIRQSARDKAIMISLRRRGRI